MKRKITFLLITLLVLSFSVKAQTSFGEQILLTGQTNGARSVYAFDIDGDGDNDVLSASYYDDKIAWYENTDGNGTFGSQKIITTQAYGAMSVYACDIDGDGDNDVLSASYYDDKIAWYENTDGNGTFGSQQIITTQANGAMSVYACDIDGDGDNDVLSASGNDDKIAWYENTDGNGTFGSQQIITTQADGAWSVYACDIDGDGDNDVLSASEDNNKIAWYENTNGNGTFGSQQIITTQANGARSVYACDIDGDGDNDVLSASGGDDKIAWYENTDGNGTFGSQQIITTQANGAMSVYACDIDGDGDNDVLSANGGDDNIAWYENTNGNGTFSSQQIITTEANSARSVYACDIDGDGDNDVLSASGGDDKIAWYENTDGNGTFGSQQIITTQAYGAMSVYACDIDGDGDNDVLSASYVDNKIAWYENTDGNGTFGLEQIITTAAIAASSVYACDIDGDGDKDVLSASQHDNKIVWYENTDGNGTFGPQKIITTSTNGANSVYACDIDGDSDNDVLSASFLDDKIAWYENTDGNGMFGSQQIITTAADCARFVYACDIDGDGDNDVLSASEDDNKIAWYENTDGNGTFGSQQIITTTTIGASSVYACDIDSDGDNDVLSSNSSWNDNKIAWYENTDGNGTFGSQQIITTNVNRAKSVYACDINGDGYNDVLSASFSDGKIAWYENLTPTSIISIQKKQLLFYPNPTSGIIYFDFTDNKIELIKIFDLTGKTIIEKTEIQQNETIDLSGFESGIYLISIQTDKEIFTTKIVKE